MSMSPQKERRRLRIVVIVAVGVLFILCLLGFANQKVLASVYTPNISTDRCGKPICPTPTPTPTNTPTPTPTPRPKPTPTPTSIPTQVPTAPVATSVSGNPTSAPTPTKVPTATPVPTPTAANNSGGITGVGHFHPGGPGGGSGFPLGNVLTVAALLLGLLAFLLYLLPRPGAPGSVFGKLRSLLIPDSLLRR